MRAGLLAWFLGAALIPAAWSQGASGAAPGASTSAAGYRDPQGRYTLRLPAGWNSVQMTRDSVQFSSGTASVSLMALPGSNADVTMDVMGKSFAGKWQNFKETDRGDGRFGGRPAKYVMFSGKSPTGANAVLRLLAMVDENLTYVLMAETPESDFTRRKSELDQIEQGFALIEPKSAEGPAVGPTERAGAAKAPAAAPASPNRSSTRQNGFFLMKLARIVDERGFEQPMTALTLLIPVDWQFQGSVLYGRGTGCHASLAHLVFRASSPDGKLAIELLPGSVWQWADDPGMRNLLMAGNQQMAHVGARGCDVLAPLPAEEFLRRAVIPYARPGAREMASEAMPEAAARLHEEARTAREAAARNGMRVNIRSSAGRVRLAYQSGGQAVEEWITAMTTNIGIAGPAHNARTGRAGHTTYYSSSADHVLAMRAQQGQLDAQEKFFRLVMGTVRVDPQWETRVRQVIADRTQQDINAANQRPAIANPAGQGMSETMHDASPNASSGREHSMESWSPYIRGVRRLRNPQTGEIVELSGAYGRAWAGPDNTYVVADSVNFNPNGSLDGRWMALEPVRR